MVFSDNEWEEYEVLSRNILGDKSDYDSIFFRDGIINVDAFEKSPYKPLFILKEVHDEYGCSEPSGGMCKNYNCCKENGICSQTVNSNYINYIGCKDIDFSLCTYGSYSEARNRNKTYMRIADLCKAFCEMNASGKVSEECKNFEEAIKYIRYCAVMNLKKLSAGGTTDSVKSQKTGDYKYHASECEKYLNSEIQRISPNVIICCGTFGGIFHYDKETKKYHYLGYECIKTEKFSHSVEYISNSGKNHNLTIEAYICDLNGKSVLLLNSYHPTYTHFTSEMVWKKYIKLLCDTIEDEISQLI